MADVTYDNRIFGSNTYPATTTFPDYVYKYPAANAAFPPKVVLPTASTPPTVAPGSATTPTNVVGGTITTTAITTNPNVVVDTEIDVSDIGLNPDGTEISIADMFDGLTTNPQMIENPEGTGYSVIGEGIFDKFMETAYKHLDAQFLTGRIRQEDYATEHLQMYLATLQMMSGQWIQFKIQQAQLRVQAAIESKRLAVQVALANKQSELELAKLNEQNKINVDSTNLQAKIQVESTNQQAKSQVDIANSQNVLTANTQTAQLKQQSDLAVYQAGVQKSVTDIQNVVQLEVTQEQVESQERQNQARIDAQAALLAAQVNSEIQKMHLYRRQIEGFDEDFKQKILKIGLDGYAVGLSVNRDAFIGSSTVGTGVPVAMTKTALDSLWNQYVMTTVLNNQEMDMNKYYRAKSTLGTNGMA